MKAVIPIKSVSLTLRADNVEQNSEALALSQDLLDEKRDQALIRIAYYQNRISSYYNLKVKQREF